ncbi:pyruvate kinase [Pasteurella multocida subsp. multocida]|uniref:pyruvate kinase n=1 Tax=Pasteurella multocida TaxID=747 RepID=UPI0022367F61|nr:pyruvate kinase [Pasteurella multocida]MCW4596772.1 pyruvate kinase [Pasteurella multocida subsp. multocida]
MKKFDLEKALAGKPVVLRNGNKAFVKFVLENPLYEDNQVVGFHIDDEGNEEGINWRKDGIHIPNVNSMYDIIGMWEEPPPTVTLTLPCPLKELEEGQKFWRITMDSDPLSIAWAKVNVGMSVFDKENIYHLALLDAGLAFKSEEDAQAWFDAMKNARR